MQLRNKEPGKISTMVLTAVTCTLLGKASSESDRLTHGVPNTEIEAKTHFAALVGQVAIEAEIEKDTLLTRESAELQIRQYFGKIVDETVNAIFPPQD